MNSVLAVGMMSGTSMDGVDAALVETNGTDHVRPIDFLSLPYGAAERDALRLAMARALLMEAPTARPEIDEAVGLVDRRHIEAATALLECNGLSGRDVHAIGYHGQTIAHRPDRGWTWQIGDGQALADALGVAVVDDFRTADVAAGGQGAPLVPVYHAARLGAGSLPAVVLNLGGVGNITFVGEDGRLLAFDTGPGNALIDDWMQTWAGLAHDMGGAAAAQGEIRDDVLDEMLDHPWFEVVPPKSLDRHDFSLDPVRGLPLADGAATLTAFTAAAVAKAIAQCPARPNAVHVAGGGRHNSTLMAMIGDRCGLSVAPVEQIGWNGDATEAEAFGYLAVRHLEGLPTSFPETTGVNAPVSGGRVSRPTAFGTRGVCV